MASVFLSVNFDLKDLERQLLSLGAAAPTIMARSVNRAAISGRTAMVKAITKDTGIRQKNVRDEIRIDQASRSRPTAVVEIRGRRLPLIAFDARGPEPSRGRGRGVSYRLPTGRNRVERGFIATMPGSGHRGVFRRRDKKRLAIIELFGPSLPHVFEKQFPVFREAAQESFVRNLSHEIDFANRPLALQEGA